MQNIISVPLEFEEWLQKRWMCRKVVFHQSQDQGFQWKYLHQHPNSYYVLMPGDRKINEQQIINVWEALKKTITSQQCIYSISVNMNSLLH